MMEMTSGEFQQHLRAEESFRRIKDIKVRDRKKERVKIDKIFDYYLNDYERPGPQPSVDGYKVNVQLTVREFDLLCRIMENRCNLDYGELSKVMGIARSTVSTNAHQLKQIIVGRIEHNYHIEIKSEVLIRVNELRNYRQEIKRREFCHRQIEDLAKSFRLMPREIVVLVCRAGICGYPRLTLQKTGKILKVTTERIRQIEAKALRKLRHPAIKRSSYLSELIEESGSYKGPKPIP